MNLKIQALLTALSGLALAVSAWAQSAAPTNFPADAQTLSPQALQERLSGKRFASRYANGITATMHYGADQAIQMDFSNGLSARGNWRVDGTRVCFQFQNVPSGCSEVRATGSHIYQRRYTTPEVIELQEVSAMSTSTAPPTTAPGGAAFHFINIDLGRTDGLLTKVPVFQRAIFLA